jgi:hypothetical protein
MMKRYALLAATAVLALAGGAQAQDRLQAGAEAARDKALTDKTAWNVLESLTTEVGPRPVGTPAMERARDWGVAKLKELGFQNVKVETFTTPTWTRVGDDTAEVLSPYPQKLHILALGRSASTPPGGLTGEIKLFKNYQEFLDAPVGSLKGKIAVVTQVMAKTQDISGYANINMQRGQGATEAAKRGAIGYMMRSLSTDDTRLPHTGGGADAGIPSVALSKPDADQLERIVARGKPVTVRINAQSTRNPASTAFNVSGEIPGTTDELVILGGHLDSWDPGTGAIDDGSGIAISTAAAKMATANGGKPRRTIRVVMWGSEEQGGASAAYAKAHEAELPKIVVVGESDDGPDSIYDVSIPKGGDAHPAMKAFRIATSTLGVVADRIPATDGGADVSGMVRAGAPVVEFRNSVLRYMDLHHSADDTLDKVDPRTLNQNVAVWASFLHTVAYSDIDFRKLAAEAPEVTGSARSRNR